MTHCSYFKGNIYLQVDDVAYSIKIYWTHRPNRHQSKPPSKLVCSYRTLVHIVSYSKKDQFPTPKKISAQM